MARQTRTGYGLTFNPLSGSTSRQYTDQHGNVYSRRAVDEFLSGKKATPKPLSVERSKPMNKYRQAVQDYKREQAKKLGVKPDAIKVRGTSDTAKNFKSLQKDLLSKDNSASGPKAQALVALGRRQPEWSFDVGDTPTGTERGKKG